MEANNGMQFKVTPDVVAKLEQRFINWLLDVVIQTVLFIVAFAIISTVAYANGNKTLPSYLLINPIGQYTFVSVIRLLYYVVLETFFGRTIGKFVTQTIVVDENGNLPKHDVILIRTLSRLIPFYEFSFIVNPTRGWHDMLSKTYVVNKKLLEEKKQQFYATK